MLLTSKTHAVYNVNKCSLNNLLKAPCQTFQERNKTAAKTVFTSQHLAVSISEVSM